MHTQSSLHLTDEQLSLVEETLSNDENSTNEEMIEFFVEEGLFQYQAESVVSYRMDYLNNIYLGENTPLRGGQVFVFKPELQSA